MDQLNDTVRAQLEEILGKNIISVIIVPVIPHHQYTVDIPTECKVLTVRVNQECVKILVSGDINLPGDKH